MYVSSSYGQKLTTGYEYEESQQSHYTVSNFSPPAYVQCLPKNQDWTGIKSHVDSNETIANA